MNATPLPLYPRERPGTHCIGGWVGLRAGVDGCGKSRLPPGFDPRTVQPVPSRYTDWAILAHLSFFKISYILLCRVAGRLVGRRARQSVGRSVRWMVGWLNGYLFACLVGWLIDWIDWLIGLLLDWLIDCLNGWIVSYVVRYPLVLV